MSLDAIVIGAGANGLAAATYLAMAGKRVLVAEAQAGAGGLCAATAHRGGAGGPRAAQALFALDPQVVRELRLSRHGLRFVARDLPLVGLRPDGRHLVLSRDAHASARRIAVHSESDAQAWRFFRRDWYARARALRELWWRVGPQGPAAPVEEESLRRLGCLGSQAWLDSWFESDALKATLGFDAQALSPLAAGSALLLFWRAAQEMCGLQGAVALPRGPGTVAGAFVAAAAKVRVELRFGARVEDISVDAAGAASGVVLSTGEHITAPWVLSSLSRRRTLSYRSVRATLGIEAMSELAISKPGASAARVTLVLDAPLSVAGSSLPQPARFVVAERLDSLAAAHAQAAVGQLPNELTMEAIVTDAGDAAGRQPLVSVLVSPVPSPAAMDWPKRKAELAARVVASLGRYIPDLGRHLAGVDIFTPADASLHGADDAFGGPVDAQRLLADWRARVRTPVRGLALCGAAADPVGAVSGRGGRAAASYVFERDAGP